MRNSRPFLLPLWHLTASLAIAATACLAGCANPQTVQVDRLSQHTYPATNLVEVLQSPPSTPYQVLAKLDAQAPAGTPIAQVLAQLQTKAGALGANAIIVTNLSTHAGGGLQFNPSGGQFSQAPSEVIPHLSAIAVRMHSGEKP